VFGSEILDVAIGLILLFLILSLVCSSVKEALETVFKYRARDLERGIRELFGDLDRQHMVPLFYNHPLINGLFKNRYNPNKPRDLPSYIPSAAFALALTDLVLSGKAQAALQANGAADSAVIPAQAPAAEPTTFTSLAHAVSNLPANSDLRGALLPLIESAGDDITRARKNIEDWFNSSMDRVSGWYKRRTQLIIAGVGFAMATFLNVDSIAIARYLNTSQTARSVLVAQVEAHRRSQPQSGETTASAQPSGPAAGPKSPTPGVQIAPPSSSELIDPLGWLERQGGIPVGWLFSPEPGQQKSDFERDWRRAPVTLGGWLMKIAGILFTGFAVALGAPFWFDVLNKFMVIRSTVKPEEKSHQEPSKE